MPRRFVPVRPCSRRAVSERKPQSTRLTVLIPFAIVTLIWGSTWIVIRDQLGVVPPSWSVAYRFAVAGVAMLAVAALGGNSLRLDRRGLAFAALVGIPQFALNFNFVYRAEALIPSGLVAVVFALLLVPNAVFSRIWLGLRMGRQLMIGSAIAIAGVALLFVHEVQVSERGAHAVLLGVALVLAGVCSASVANVAQATDTARNHPMMTTLGWAMLIGAGADAAFAWATVGPPVVDWRPGYIAGILYLALPGSVVTFPLYFRLLRVIGPTKAAYSSVLVPVIAMALSTLFEGYRWSLLPAAGSALVLVGLVAALRARRPNR